ncbi:MAG: hypothetical protein K2M31_08580 [Muribaculaceae bacterium]|nr:hypothetical protein [Muribaculaceae bacterium]
MKRTILIPALIGLMACGMMSSCKGRTADNMEPTGETVRVVIPEQDVDLDSAVAAGDAESL